VADPQVPTDAKPLVFFHVMKCGGTSVRAALATGVAARRNGPDVFELDGEAAKVAAGGTDLDNWTFRDALLPYVLQTLRPPVVLGHFRYRDRYAQVVDSAHFVTVLRDPVERIVSLYKYRRYKADVDVPVSLTFDEFLATKRWAKEGHLYVDTFRGRDDLDSRSDEAVAAAVANLRHFAVVGFLDRLEDFSSRVTECTGKPVTIPIYNTSPAPEDSDIDAAARERAKAVCEPDCRLYEQVRAALT
jgi:hypothetical protein